MGRREGGGGEAAANRRGERVDVADDARGDGERATGDDGEDVANHVLVAHDVDVVALGFALETADGERGARGGRIRE